MHRISTTIDGKNEEDLVSKTSSLDVPNVDCFQVPTLSASEGESTKSLNGILSPAYMTSIWQIKCTRVYPCTGCTLVGQECNFRGDDSRRRPVGRNYVVALEGQVGQYESLLRKVKAASGEERSALLDSVSFDDHLSSLQQNSSNSEPSIDTKGSPRMSTMSFQPSPQGKHSE